MLFNFCWGTEQKNLLEMLDIIQSQFLLGVFVFGDDLDATTRYADTINQYIYP
jgi:hypothetical protein